MVATNSSLSVIRTGTSPMLVAAATLSVAPPPIMMRLNRALKRKLAAQKRDRKASKAAARERFLEEFTRIQCDGVDPIFLSAHQRRRREALAVSGATGPRPWAVFA